MLPSHPPFSASPPGSSILTPLNGTFSPGESACAASAASGCDPLHALPERRSQLDSGQGGGGAVQASESKRAGAPVRLQSRSRAAREQPLSSLGGLLVSERGMGSGAA